MYQSRELCIDMGGAILSYPSDQVGIAGDDIMLIENMFHMSGRAFKGTTCFLPEKEDLGKMSKHRLRE